MLSILAIHVFCCPYGRLPITYGLESSGRTPQNLTNPLVFSACFQYSPEVVLSALRPGLVGELFDFKTKQTWLPAKLLNRLCTASYMSHTHTYIYIYVYIYIYIYINVYRFFPCTNTTPEAHPLSPSPQCCILHFHLRFRRTPGHTSV